MLKDQIIQKLYDFLLSEEKIPFWDKAEVVTILGGDAKIRIQAIKECINIINNIALPEVK